MVIPDHSTHSEEINLDYETPSTQRVVPLEPKVMAARVSKPRL